MDEIKNKRQKPTEGLSKKGVSPQFLEHGKIPPQAVDLEEAVLGALMLEKDAVSAVIDILTAKVFYKDAHQRILKTNSTLYSK